MVLDGSGSFDFDLGTIVSYAWAQTLGAPLAFTDDAAAMSVAFGEPGTFEFELTVTDDAGYIATDRVRVEVLAVGPPCQLTRCAERVDEAPDQLGAL